MHFTLPPKAYLFLSVFLLLMGGYPLPITLFQLVLIFGCLMLAWCAIGLKSRGQTFVSALFAWVRYSITLLPGSCFPSPPGSWWWVSQP